MAKEKRARKRVMEIERKRVRQKQRKGKATTQRDGERGRETQKE